VEKFSTTPGNRLRGSQIEYCEEGAERRFLDGPQAMIWFSPEGIHWFVSAAIPRSVGAYERNFATVDELYEEILHYYFDADSRMSLEIGFEAVHPQSRPSHSGQSSPLPWPLFESPLA
jgi:hypothetical protein